MMNASAIAVGVAAAVSALLQQLSRFAEKWLSKESDQERHRMVILRLGQRAEGRVRSLVKATASAGVAFERTWNLEIERLARGRSTALIATAAFLGPIAIVFAGWIASLKFGGPALPLLSFPISVAVGACAHQICVRLSSKSEFEPDDCIGWRSGGARLLSRVRRRGRDLVASLVSIPAYFGLLLAFCMIDEPFLALGFLVVVSPVLFLVALPMGLGASLKVRRNVMYELAGRRKGLRTDLRDEIVEAVYSSAVARISMLLTATAMCLGVLGSGHPGPMHPLFLLLFMFFNVGMDTWILRDSFDRLGLIAGSDDFRAATNITLIGLAKALGSVFFISAFGSLLYVANGETTTREHFLLVLDGSLGDPSNLLAQSPLWWASKSTLLPGVGLGACFLLLALIVLMARGIRRLGSRGDLNPYSVLETLFGVVWKALAVIEVVLVGLILGAGG